MSHVAHVTGDVLGRGFQAAGIVVGAARQHAAVREHRRLEDLGAAEVLAEEIVRLRRQVALAQAETRRARAETAVLVAEVGHASARADRAETALARLLRAIQA
ncbi:hypothetical protein [Methylobacterium sp. J-068]|uniref:hypothetical protein n=1 Tax=Methylobacterium sp. J-068 TaxID=2836649 RepID=UPI001FB969C3|nr:hypothetical protein [Methylobacterium sp. J-068]MCJ2032996.1 hypothetical protein [Methylobacterium sp. J-068]